MLSASSISHVKSVPPNSISIQRGKKKREKGKREGRGGEGGKEREKREKGEGRQEGREE